VCVHPGGGRSKKWLQTNSALLAISAYWPPFSRFRGIQKPPNPQVYPKPSREAQAEVGGAKKVLLSDVYGTTKRKLLLNRSWGKVDVTYVAFMVFIHGLCLFAPMTFSWPMVGMFAVSYLVTGQIHTFSACKSFSACKGCRALESMVPEIRGDWAGGVKAAYCRLCTLAYPSEILVRGGP